MTVELWIVAGVFWVCCFGWRMGRVWERTKNMGTYKRGENRIWNGFWVSLLFGPVAVVVDIMMQQGRKSISDGRD